MLTNQDQFWLDRRDNCTANECAAIDEIFTLLYSYTKDAFISAAGDDRAASLEAALVRFLIESREG